MSARSLEIQFATQMFPLRVPCLGWEIDGNLLRVSKPNYDTVWFPLFQIVSFHEVDEVAAKR